jgi:predicted secreted protein
MTWVTGTVLYIIIWWTVLFTMLPIGEADKQALAA